ncbi:MAG: ATP-binding cassette domain-containing protein, partial [Burkholderiaceae bacterium]|nr:ATP-binding cassette domain-containing protein [Burkholderiaceae bacterium]
MQAADRGKIWIDGLDVTRGWSTKDAIASGVGMIHQHFSLVREHTVLENIAMPTLGWRQLRIDWDAHRERLDTISREFGLSLNPGALVEHLTMGERQQVEILKMLYQGARILILDEPTSVLTPQQAQSLFETLGRFRDSGLSVVMITHKLSDAMRVCDRITVLRHGKFIGTVQPSDTTVSGLAQMMVAQQIEPIARLRHIPAERDVLEARALVVRNRGATAVDGVSLRVRAGEVLGIAGVAGNGQTELAQALLGLCPPHSGGIFLDRADVTGLSVRERRDAGLAFVPEDRHSMAMVAQMDVASNMILHSVGGKAFSRRGILNRAAIEANALRNVAEFDIRVRSPDAPMGTLSGGNQQKVVLSRELSGGPCALVVCEL